MTGRSAITPRLSGWSRSWPLAYAHRGAAWCRKRQFEKAIADLDERHPSESWTSRPATPGALPGNPRGSTTGPSPTTLRPYGDDRRVPTPTPASDRARDGSPESDKVRTWTGASVRPEVADAYHDPGVVRMAKELYTRRSGKPRGWPRPMSAGASRLASMETTRVRLLTSLGDPPRAEDGQGLQPPGPCIFRGGDIDRAIADLDRAIPLDPEDANAHAWRARVWATCPEGRYRDTRKAIESATRACGLTGWKVPEHVDTLAAAYAEAGDLDAAVRWQEKAISLPAAPGQRSELAAHLDGYRRRSRLGGRPIRE